jgi:hypothetical protein
LGFTYSIVPAKKGKEVDLGRLWKQFAEIFQQKISGWSGGKCLFSNDLAYAPLRKTVFSRQFPGVVAVELLADFFVP